ncbi:MAG: hypothetical protein DWQ07_03250 [Chloroflexi bacterium]|nr:MAG: hypothetical protein DWQ07_03250 [Chloroflexota bacterium]MBL1193483.1 hypothetical protein [Chloroflexota bacterium]NOH10774.1 hypothetical protein [Chloroflexota bacterium]
MATAKRVFNQIELNFWNVAIPLMSDTPELQKVGSYIGGLLTKYHQLPKLLRSIMWTTAGGLLGLAIGAFIGLLFR